MLKLGFGIMIFIITSYVGFQYGETFNKRFYQIREILKGITILQNDILYGSKPLPESFEDLSYKIGEPFSTFSKGIKEELISGNVESVYDGAAKEYKKIEDKCYLNDDDKKIMSDFFKSLGESGVYGQEKIFILAIEGLKVNARESEENAKKNVKLYRYLGICLGAMIMIFIL